MHPLGRPYASSVLRRHSMVASLHRQSGRRLRRLGGIISASALIASAIILLGAQTAAHSSTEEQGISKPEVAGSSPAGPTMTFTQYEIIDTFQATVTAYSPVETCPGGDAHNCVTAFGSRPRSGRTVACPRTLHFGTRIQVEGKGIYVCEDRTALRFDGRYDIYMDDYAEARAFGKQRLEVKVLRSI